MPPAGKDGSGGPAGSGNILGIAIREFGEEPGMPLPGKKEYDINNGQLIFNNAKFHIFNKKV
jgi:hypothetical protein